MLIDVKNGFGFHFSMIAKEDNGIVGASHFEVFG
jgi:hypothetical protein